jgi:hypothetical protein
MSNNKLYTEEQVKMAIQMADKYNYLITLEECGILNQLTPIELPSDSLCINCDESESTHNICMDCIIKIGKENIELPSDKEIKDASIKYYVNKSACFYFEIGAKYLRDKIGGNNEQQ